MNCDSVELLPNPAFLMQSTRRIGYTLETALADIIDNSISADASIISVQYRWNDANPWIAITDNGCGMSATEIKEAMRLGGRGESDSKTASLGFGAFRVGAQDSIAVAV